MAYRILTGLIVTAALVFGVSCTDAEAPRTGDSLTAAGALAELKSALQQDGAIAHGSMELTTTFQGTTGRLGSIEYWYDADRQLGRQEWTIDEDNQLDMAEWVIAIVTEEGVYLDDGSSTHTISPLDPAPRALLDECDELSLAVAVVPTAFTRCFGGWASASTPPNTVDYDGSPALALTGRSPGFFGEPADSTTTLYLNVGTHVPRAIEVRVPTQDALLLITHHVEFIPIDSLAANFFDLSEAAYLEPVAGFDAIEASVPIYWLGPVIALASGPELFLQRVDGANGPGHAARLEYEGDDGSHVDIATWLPPVWAEFLPTELGQSWWTADCVEAESIAGRNRSGTIYSGYQNGVCRADAPFDGFMAVVEFEDAVVTINTPNCFTCGPGGTAPDILRQVIADLGRRAPDR